MSIDHYLDRDIYARGLTDGRKESSEILAAKDAEIAELVDANATLQGHATRMETTHAATCEMLRMGNDALVAEIEGLRRAFNNNMDDMLVVVNEVKRLREGIAEIKSKIGAMTCDAVTFEAAHGIFCDLRKLLADSPAPATEAIVCKYCNDTGIDPNSSNCICQYGLVPSKKNPKK